MNKFSRVKRIKEVLISNLSVFPPDLQKSFPPRPPRAGVILKSLQCTPVFKNFTLR